MMRKGSSSSSTSTKGGCSSSKMGLKRGPWTEEEDKVLSKFIEKEGEGRWRTLPKRAGLMRCGKSCRLRWMNYLRPCVKRGHIAPDEEDLILRLHRLLGNRWSLIAGRIPGRTDNEIKNYWNTHLSKKLIRQGIDPRTHKPLSSSTSPTSPTPHPCITNNNHHMKKKHLPPPAGVVANVSSTTSEEDEDNEEEDNNHMMMPLMMEPYTTTTPSSSTTALDPYHPHHHDDPLPFPTITSANDNDDVFSSFLNSLINDHSDPLAPPLTNPPNSNPHPL